MKILTLNINSIRAHLESFLKIISSGEYDTILVQELKVENSNFPYNVFEEYGYNIRVFGQKSWNGVATFSKYSIEDVTLGLPTINDNSARFLECVIDGHIRLINVYMPNGESIESTKFQNKLDWMNAFTKYISRYTNSIEQVIIGGDFNVSINDIDIWKPQNYIGSSISAPMAREIMQTWLNNGWTDTWRHIHPNEIDYTWYGYRGKNTVEKKQGLRLDYFLTNKSALQQTQGCEIDITPRLATKPTDHCGLALILK